MLSNELRTVNDVLRKYFPEINSSGLRLEQKRVKMGTSYCLLAGAGNYHDLTISILINSFDIFRNILSSCCYSLCSSKDNNQLN
jgi:hypothetical protein